MPAINVDIQAAGPLLNVVVNFSIPRMQAMNQAGVATPANVMGQFLVDTGATSTCVDPELINGLNLPQIGKVAISTPSTNGQQHFCEQYDASVFIPGANAGQGFLIPALPIITTHLRSQGIDGLIGRDIIDRCTLVYIGSAKVLSLNF